MRRAPDEIQLTTFFSTCQRARKVSIACFMYTSFLPARAPVASGPAQMPHDASELSIRRIAGAYRAKLGESPVWTEDGRLAFVDIVAK